MTALKTKLLKLIHAKGINQNALAAAINVDPSQLSRWLKEGGAHNHMPTPEQFVKLSEFFQVPLIYLMDDRMDEMPPRVEAAPLPDDVRLLLRLAELMGGPEVLMRKVVGSETPTGRVRAEPARRPEEGDGPNPYRKSS